MKGIKETKELISFFGTAANVLSTVTADGKIQLLEYSNFVQVLQPGADAFDNIAEVPSEVLDIDDNEYKELIAHVGQAFNLNTVHENYEELAEDILTALLAFARAFAEAKKIFK